MPNRMHNESVDFVHRLTLDASDSEGEESFDSASSPCKPLRGSQLFRQGPVLADASSKINSLSSYSFSASMKHSGSRPSRGWHPQLLPPRELRSGPSNYPSPLHSPTDSLPSLASLTSLAPPSTTSVVSELDSDLGTEVETDGEIEDAEYDDTLADPLDSDAMPEPYMGSDTFKHGSGSMTDNSSLAQQFSRPYSARHIANRPATAPDEGYPWYHRPNKSVLGIPLSQNWLGQTEEEDGEDHSRSPQASNAAWTREHEGNRANEAPRTNAIAPFRPVSARENVWMPHTKVRRTQSMFATPEQMLHEQQLGNMDRALVGGSQGPSLSILDGPDSPIETFAVRHDPFLRITHETLCKIIDGEFGHLYTHIMVIDCRFDYEYEGGHIEGAINVSSKQQLEQALFQKELCDAPGNKLLVFHCEYSAYRSPMLASHLRNCDRSMNAARYPNLCYPDVVVLHGGYNQFYNAAAHRCVPRNYVGMNHEAHQSSCEREMSKFRSQVKSRKFRTFGMVSTPHLTEFKFPGTEAMAQRSASVSDLPQTVSPGTAPSSLSLQLDQPSARTAHTSFRSSNIFGL